MIRVLPAACVAMVALGMAVIPADARGRGGWHGGGGRCSYCGCRGGPGYRGPDGNCVGKRNITKVCGSPPSTRCKFEGKSGGLNQTPALPPIVRPTPNPFQG